MLNKSLGALGIAALVCCSWGAPASAAGWGGGGSHGSHFAGGHAWGGHPWGGHPWGHGWWGHHHFFFNDFFFFGDPFFDFGFGFYPYYDPYPVDYVPAPEDDGYWYYCRDSRSFYPYVSQCASEWERVPPSPPPPDAYGPPDDGASPDSGPDSGPRDLGPPPGPSN